MLSFALGKVYRLTECKQCYPGENNGRDGNEAQNERRLPR